MLDDDRDYEPDHSECTDERARHNCSCHLHPPCPACVGCHAARAADEIDVILITDSPARARRRFTVRRVRLYGAAAPSAPWIIKDRDRPAWIGAAPTREAAFLAIGYTLATEAG